MQKILVIDDDTDITKILKKQLTDAGFKVSVAYDALQGVGLLHKEMPDLIIVDLEMPAGGGLKIIRTLKTSFKTESIPVIVLSGTQDESLVRPVADEDVVDFLLKPYDLQILMGAIRKALPSLGDSTPLNKQNS